jgi:ligand-binding sensor domain-containing protein/signal transduction histidine kinase
MRSQSTLLDAIVGLCILACLTSLRAVASDRYLSTFDQIPAPNFGRVNAILRDHRGFLWFGTDRGLRKFDGYQVRVFIIGSPSDEKQQIVTAIAELDSASLLLATGKGMWRFSLITEQSTPFLPGAEIAQSRVNTIARDRSGTIWIGTDSHGLFRYIGNSSTMKQFSISNGLSSNRILFLVPDLAGRLWIGTYGGGLNSLDMTTSHIVHYRSNATDPGALYTDKVFALCSNGDGELWIGTSEGLNVLHIETDRMVRLDLRSNIKHTIMSIARDHSGRMWVAALDLGLLFHSDGKFKRFSTLNDPNRSLNSIRVLFPDPVASTQSNVLLWVGTRAGVNKILMSTNPFSNHIRNEDSLYMDRGAVLSLCEDHNGVLWAGMWGGGLEALRHVNGSYRRIANFKNSPLDPLSLPHNDVGRVMEDRKGNLWIGTAAGLAVLDARRKQMAVYKHVKGDSTSLAGNDVAGIYEDRSGALWICTRGGLSQVLPGEPRRFRNYLNDPKEANDIGGNFVSGILEDNHSNHWVATYGRGLNKLEANGTVKRFLHPGDSTRTQENWIYSFVEDHNGLFWLSTLAELVSFDPQSGQFTQHQIEQLRDVHIFGIHVDNKNDLWLSTEIGLAKFSPTTMSFTRFDETYGIAFSELHSGFFKNTRGKLFVGGLDGFTAFDPESINRDSQPPKIAITSLAVFENDVSASDLAGASIRLPHDRNFLSFSFAALDYANPRQNRFAYRMVGVDNDWVGADTRNYASYSHLNPGNYVFQVRGCNSDNVWNKTGTSISIVIAPPYWQTWWFRVLAATIVMSAMYAAYRYRLHKVLEVERLRLRIADDLHDDVGSSLSAIAIASKSMQTMPELTTRARKKLTEIYKTALSTSEGMKDLVWFIKPETDVLEDLFLRMKETAPSLLGDIDIDVYLPNSVDSKTISVDFKRCIFLAFKEAVTNIAKHAHATKVEIRLGLQDNIVEMVIRDNGKGFDTNAHHRGTGLHSLHKRAKSIGGTCEIVSQPEQGTTVKFSGKVH